MSDKSVSKRQYPRNVIEALDGAIEKWYRITFKGGVDKLAEDCPLCAIFVIKHCEGCPICEDTGIGSCVGTPFQHWKHRFVRVEGPESAQAAYNFYDWLRKLRDRVEEEPEEQFQPFTITVNTLEEAQELWHRLNLATIRGNGHYHPEHHLQVPWHDTRTDGMWKQVDQGLHPE